MRTQSGGNLIWWDQSSYHLKLIPFLRSLLAIISPMINSFGWATKGALSPWRALIILQWELLMQTTMVKVPLSILNPLSRKKIWCLNIHPKVRIFAWHICKNGLPTMLALRCIGLNTFGFCLLCDNEMESIQYAFLLCPHTKHTWATWLDCPLNLSSTGDDILNIAAKFIDLGKLHDLDLFFMVSVRDIY